VLAIWSGARTSMIIWSCSWLRLNPQARRTTEARNEASHPGIAIAQPVSPELACSCRIGWKAMKCEISNPVTKSENGSIALTRVTQ
jgi:hypothetical protein